MGGLIGSINGRLDGFLVEFRLGKGGRFVCLVEGVEERFVMSWRDLWLVDIFGGKMKVEKWWWRLRKWWLKEMVDRTDD
jgi:hypothetical protein